MSRNFELMREMEKGKGFRSKVLIEPPFPLPGEDRKRDDCHQMASDGTLGLVQRIFLRQTQDTPRMVVFAGIDHGCGCSQIAASVAETLATNAPRGVCLVDANFHSPGLPSMLGSTNFHGLTNALLEEGPIWSFVKPALNDRMWFLSSGPIEADSPNLLTSARMGSRSAELRREFDFIIVDAPPMTRHADAIALGQVSDGLVLVLEAESTRREAALAVVENLRSSQVQILGAVLNKRVFPIPEGIYNRL
jgi:succinoglycan biosynthesis transport protein ExoP